jgi:predicted dehydrogenase
MESNRRSFLKGAAITAAPLFIPRGAWGANDRISYGVIATGNRGAYLNQHFQKVGAQCAALCDIYEPHLEKAKSQSPAGVKTYVDYHELLAQPDLDAVVIAAPDHHHCPMLLAALEAKKDVYCEKPLSKSMDQNQRMIDAVRAGKQVVQIGMQRRSNDYVLRAKKLIDDGVLGAIYMVKPYWNWNIAKPLDNSPLEGHLDWDRFLGSAPKRDLEPMRFRSWRQFRDYAGGNMTDQGTHLMDVTQWFTKSGPPSAALMHGFIAKSTGADYPDVFCAIFEYPKHMVTWTLNYTSSYEENWRIQFQGDKGTMMLFERGYLVYGDPWPKNQNPIYQETSEGPNGGLTGNNSTESHISNFLECIRSRKDPNCTVEIAAQAVTGPHMANLAFDKGCRYTLA